MEREEKVPNDVLTRTIELASKFPAFRGFNNEHYLCIESRGGPVDIESLVDNFINFHSGGRLIIQMCRMSAFKHGITEANLIFYVHC